MAEPEPIGEANAASPPRTCPNCAFPAPGRFCASCGQEQRPLRVPFHRVVAEALEETLSLDSKLARTLPALFLHPGAATRHHIDGRRASHTSPVKLYLVASFAFFLALAMGPDLGLRVQAGADGGDVASESPQEADVPPIRASPGALEELRGAGSLGALFAERLKALQALPPREATRRINQAIVENTARAMFVLVPVMALVLLALHPRRRLYYTEHLVAATHAQTVTFAFLLPGAAFGSEVLTLVGLAAAGGHLLVAMRRVYRTGWPGTVLRWLALSAAYLVALALAVVVATAVAVLVS